MIVAFLLIGVFALPATARAGPSPSGGGSAPNPGNVTPWVKQVPGSPGGTTSQ